MNKSESAKPKLTHRLFPLRDRADRDSCCPRDQWAAKSARSEAPLRAPGRRLQVRDAQKRVRTRPNSLLAACPFTRNPASCPPRGHSRRGCGPRRKGENATKKWSGESDPFVIRLVGQKGLYCEPLSGKLRSSYGSPVKRPSTWRISRSVDWSSPLYGCRWVVYARISRRRMGSIPLSSSGDGHTEFTSVAIRPRSLSRRVE